MALEQAAVPVRLAAAAQPVQAPALRKEPMPACPANRLQRRDTAAEHAEFPQSMLDQASVSIVMVLMIRSIRPPLLICPRREKTL